MIQCACCRKKVNSEKGEPIYLSYIVGSDHYLCEFCSDVEEATIVAIGTTDLPRMLNNYGVSNTQSHVGRFTWLRSR